MNISTELNSGSSPKNMVPHAVETIEKVEIPIDMAIAFQTMLIQNYWKDESGRPLALDHEAVQNWAFKYGKAFRDFCYAHPAIAKHINDGIITFDEEKQMYVYTKNISLPERLTEEEISLLLDYVRAHGQDPEDAENKLSEFLVH